ncbi:4Fe-4S double cluster binding domain-containing protein [Acidaminococcus massiliensis]|jgi:epoxyqueuosine reductase QueG|uniref:4Fe-4S double cluster binding domain-containing protein n=1 Tax=Acidaminococcus massiliensis TaxID=1852375 RepID=UPI00248E23C1|nr:4Fe-4S double cluster binding domain-containing protein [Acidaminococcus massiliensis]
MYNNVKEVFDRALAPFPGVKWACCPLDFSQWKESGKYNYALLVYAPYDEIMTIWKYKEPRQAAQKRRRSAAMKEVAAALEKAAKAAGIPFLIPPVTRDNMSPPYKMSLSSKEVGVRSGVGWIGRSDLLITYDYGPRIETVSAVFYADHMETRPPVTKNQCGDCSLCVKACPFHLITGKTWKEGTPREELLDYHNCSVQRDLLGRKMGLGRKFMCARCLLACPVGVENIQKLNASLERKEENGCTACSADS